jgi:NAD(P)H-hydrate repair Nnr-like enzyme with NAD(P)H-hydrate dehydratase domain
MGKMNTKTIYITLPKACAMGSAPMMQKWRKEKEKELEKTFAELNADLDPVNKFGLKMDAGKKEEMVVLAPKQNELKNVYAQATRDIKEIEQKLKKNTELQ